MRKLLFLFILSVAFFSCRSEFDFEPSTGNLAFSKKTVYLDTVFTNIGSSTYNLKVYNKSNKNISIPKLKLAKGQASKYRLNVDGKAGTEFENVELLANDSMFVFIEVTASAADANPSDFLYTDEIQFGDNNNFQKVDLVTLIKDAVFIYPERAGSPNNFTYEQINLGLDANNNPIIATGSNLSAHDPVNGNELVWTNAKPYVVYGYAKVPNNLTLTVNAGARVHFHANSGLIVPNNASIKVNGTTSSTPQLENEVIFEGDRLEPNFSETPGQWGTIWFLPGSKNNVLNNLTIKNATVGVLVSGNDGTINSTINFNNVQIYNCANVGVLARTGNLTGQNMVINNCGQASLACTFGGRYNFTHCTFANYWNRPNQTSVLIDDFDGNPIYALNQADFKNCIIYGNTNFGLSLSKKGSVFNYQFNHCLIKFVDSNNQFTNNPLFQFTNISNYVNCKIANSNQINNPFFKEVSKNNFKILQGSAAIGAASFSNSGFADILNINRTSPSDMGAFKFVP